ncbi:hypothetical protein QMT40_001832 [Parvibaculaceae bacterium PLY_AMNH_Bact1]|nr:hypothetical protein QMT40_001832 [Parvibaculaceae bacterium PLY_AMNH_Bact1]
MVTPQEERDNRVQQINDLLMPYVKPSPHASVMQNQYQQVAEISRKCWSLEMIDDVWVAAFRPGSHVGDCCATAYNLHTLTNIPVGLQFNDIFITIGAEG